MPHPLLDLLTITEQDCRKAGVTEAQVVKAILTDNLVTLRAQELMVHQFATHVVADMGLLEKERLRKHALPRVAEKIGWEVNPISQYSGQPMTGIRATCGGESEMFMGSPEKAIEWAFHGQKCPAHLIEEYRRGYVPTPVSNATFKQLQGLSGR